jgi:hypothetical protein
MDLMDPMGAVDAAARDVLLRVSISSISSIPSITRRRAFVTRANTAMVGHGGPVEIP